MESVISQTHQRIAAIWHRGAAGFTPAAIHQTVLGRCTAADTGDQYKSSSMQMNHASKAVTISVIFANICYEDSRSVPLLLLQLVAVTDIVLGYSHSGQHRGFNILSDIKYIIKDTQGKLKEAVMKPTLSRCNNECSISTSQLNIFPPAQNCLSEELCKDLHQKIDTADDEHYNTEVKVAEYKKETYSWCDGVPQGAVPGPLDMSKS
ncbi:Hypothetical predicted protein [Scomber scombrus]|uniref:Uncharacterized protein n=1 Tax=Scomber scombrus TaxID=13677 RepID=A0AAV1MT68_SCOSC